MSSLIPGYEYDIFISYRHNDNLNGWVSDFVSALENELKVTLKEPVTIYFDKNPDDGLRETHHVDKSLERKLKSFIFIPVISQTYCDPMSFAWQSEFCVFNKSANLDDLGREIKLASGNVASRMLPVRIHDLDAEDKSLLENELGGVLRAIEFIYKEAGVNRPLKPEDRREENLNKTSYRNQINKAANAVKEIIQGAKSPPGRETATNAAGKSGPSRPARKYLAMISLAVLILLMAVYFFLPSRFFDPMQGHADDKSIAVLAFDDISPNQDQGYIGDGIAEELIFALSKVPDLRVAGRHSAFSFKGKNVDLRQVGAELGVSTLLTGSIRKSGNTIRVLVQLINVSDGFQLWSEQYDKELTNILVVEQAIALAVTSSLNVSNKGGIASYGNKLQSVEAYDVYLKARQKLALRGVDNLMAARSLFQEAVRLNPSFSPAYSGLGRVLTLLPLYTFSMSSEEAINYGNKAISKALELDVNNAEAYAVRGTLASYYEWNWKLAGESLQKAYSMAPQNAEVVNFLGDYYRQIRDPRALETEELAVTMDPLRSINYSDLAACYWNDRDFGNAAGLYRRAFDMSPTAFSGTAESLVRCYLKLDSLEEAKSVVAKLKSVNEDGSKTLLLIELNVRISYEENPQMYPSEQLDTLETLAKVGKYDPFNMAEVFAGTHQDAKSLEMLEVAYRQRSFSLVAGSLDEFQHSEAFKAIFERPGLRELMALRKGNGK